MRKIEQQMVMAAKSHRDWKSDNGRHGRPPTTQTVRCIGCTRVYLYGNEIAKVLDNGSVVPNIVTLRQYPTNTTKSRLRALGVDVYQKDYAVYVDGRAI